MQTMRAGYWTVLVSLLALFTGCAKKVNDPADVQAIKRSMDEYGNALNSRDASAAVARMTDKTHYSDANAASVAGKEAVRNKLQRDFERLAPYDLKFNTTVADVQVNGDLGAARGYWKMKAKHKDEALAPIDNSGSWALICLRQGDGSWKWNSVTLSSDQPLPGTTQDGSEEQALIQLERDTTGAMARADTDTIERMLAAGPEAGTDPIQRRAAPVRHGSFNLESMKLKEVKPHVFGDAAIVKMKGEMKGSYNGKQVSGTLHGVDFFVKREGQWQAVYSQNTSTIP
jgi:ketosteroid isomerase-like protein